MGDQRTEAGASPVERDRLDYVSQSVGSVPGLNGGDTPDSKPPLASSETPAPGPSASRRALARVRDWLSANEDELLITSSLVVLGVVVRLLWLREIETFGDAAQKWHFA